MNQLTLWRAGLREAPRQFAVSTTNYAIVDTVNSGQPLRNPARQSFTSITATIPHDYNLTSRIHIPMPPQHLTTLIRTLTQRIPTIRR